MKLITEIVDDDKIEVLIEENKGGKKDYYIKGVFMQAETKNRNGRVYPRETLGREVEKYSDNPRVEFAWGIGGDDKMNSSSWILHGYFERQQKLLGI